MEGLLVEGVEEVTDLLEVVEPLQHSSPELLEMSGRVTLYVRQENVECNFDQVPQQQRRGLQMKLLCSRFLSNVLLRCGTTMFTSQSSYSYTRIL